MPGLHNYLKVFSLMYNFGVNFIKFLIPIHKFRPSKPTTI
jgi:hypothetical protein